MQLIDTHCHLYLSDFLDDLNSIITRAKTAAVTHFFLPSIDSENTLQLFELESRDPSSFHPMMGLHPCSIKKNYMDELDLVHTWLSKRSFAAIGEIGLDYYWDISFQAEQLEAFRKQIEWALLYQLPIVIHSRNALDECIQVVREYIRDGIEGIFHCFSGSKEQAESIIGMGFYLGIGGVLTYKNAGLAETIKDIPLESLVLETDAPYLSPVPYRGKRNESSYLRVIAEKLATVKNISLEEVAAITTANAQKIFRI